MVVEKLGSYRRAEVRSLKTFKVQIMNNQKLDRKNTESSNYGLDERRNFGFFLKKLWFEKTWRIKYEAYIWHF